MYDKILDEAASLIEEHKFLEAREKILQLDIDNEKNIRAISDNVITMMYSGLEKGYDDSYVSKWLNDTEKSKFTKELYGLDLLTNSFRCEDKVDDMTKITCENLNMSNKVTILSLYDYYNAGGKSSFLNNGETYYLSTTDSSNGTYFITETGEIAKDQVSTKLHGVRPVITLSSKTKSHLNSLFASLLFFIFLVKLLITLDPIKAVIGNTTCLKL